MIKSSLTISLVPGLKNIPYIFSGDLNGSCRKAAKIGFDGIEILATDAGSLDEKTLKDCLSKNNLKLAAMGTGGGFLTRGLYLCDPDARRRKEAISFVAEFVKLAGAFGAPSIIGCMQGRVADGFDRKKAERMLKDALEEFAVLADQFGVPVLLEPLNRRETNFINRLDQAVGIIDAIGCRNIKILADLYHMSIEEKSICDALKASADYIGHIHMADSNRRPAGFGDIDFVEVGRTLRKIGYNGYVSVEALPYPEPVQAAEQSMKVFKECILGEQI